MSAAMIPADAAGQADFLERHERRQMVFDLRRRAMTHQQIADALTEHFGEKVSRQAVSKMLKRGLERMHREEAESVEELRALENDRLDELLRVWGPRAREGNEKAAGIVLRIAERRAKMNGLDAPVKHEHDVRGSILHELGVDPEEVKRSRDAWQTAFGDTGAPDPIDGTATELPSGVLDG
jgi:hypothetical protein